VAAPLSFNSLNKWAQGISDTLALGLLNENIGLRIPITAAIWAKESLRNHPAYTRSLGTLRPAATMLEPPDIIDPDRAGGQTTISWNAIALA